MGTRADFYIGRGPDAHWLGSIAWDGYPDGIFTEFPELFAGPPLTLDEYRNWLTRYLSTRKDATLPEHGWPWPWDDSNTTDYAYAYEPEDSKIYASCFGTDWYALDPEAPDYGAPGAFLDENGDLCYPDYDPNANTPKEKQDFPDMSALKATTYGERSGIMIISVPTPGNA